MSKDATSLVAYLEHLKAKSTTGGMAGDGTVVVNGAELETMIGLAKGLAHAPVYETTQPLYTKKDEQKPSADVSEKKK